MLRPPLLCLAAALAVGPLGATLLATSPAGAGNGPKVLLVDLDDMGYELLAATPTPTLDWVALRGRAFTSYTTAPNCSPTRAMMMMGAYPSHPEVLLGQVIHPMTAYELPLDTLDPLPRIVEQAGYSTAKIGKWHLCNDTRFSHANEAGWRDYSGVLGNLINGTADYNSYWKVQNGVATQVTGTYLTTDETNDAISCVRAGVDLVSVSYHAPHKPWHEPPSHLHSISPITSDWDRTRAMLQACDRELGRLLREALPRGYLVLIAADNGTARPIGGWKGTMHDSGVVVPFFAIGAGIVPGVDDTLIGAEDLYATIAEYMGIPHGPPHRGPHSDSFLGALFGGPDVRRFQYSERFWARGIDPRGGNIRWLRMVRGSRYKFVRDETFDRETLFDLHVDPEEKVNLFDVGVPTGAASAALDHFRLVLERL